MGTVIVKASARVFEHIVKLMAIDWIYTLPFDAYYVMYN